MMITFN